MLMGTYHVLSRIVEPYGTLSYSQEGEDLILRRLFEEQSCGFYVDVGAHHPQRFSNTFLFYKRGWRGINIDPEVDAIAEFQRSRPRDINLVLGISNEVGELRYYRFNESALNTFDGELAHQREQIPAYRLIESVTVPVKRLDDVLSEHLPAGQEIDFLSVDAEGFDLKILRSNDWTCFRPRCVLIEALGSSLATLSSNPAHAHLDGVGYELFAKTVNTLIYLERDERAQEE
jgi:FkbM family methyltransferase